MIFARMLRKKIPLIPCTSGGGEGLVEIIVVPTGEIVSVLWCKCPKLNTKHTKMCLFPDLILMSFMVTVFDSCKETPSQA